MTFLRPFWLKTFILLCFFFFFVIFFLACFPSPPSTASATRKSRVFTAVGSYSHNAPLVCRDNSFMEHFSFNFTQRRAYKARRGATITVCNNKQSGAFALGHIQGKAIKHRWATICQKIDPRACTRVNLQQLALVRVAYVHDADVVHGRHACVPGDAEGR